MTTPQPPGGGHEGAPGYGQPQDPWSGHEPGLASAPTNPITPQYDPYGPTVPAGALSQSTVVPQFPYPQPPPRTNAGVIALAVTVVLALGGGGGYGAYRYFTTHRTNGAGSTPTASATTPSAPDVFPYTAKTGDCIVNVGTVAKPRMAPSACSAAGSYTIVKIARGASIPVGPKGSFDTDTTSAVVCAGIDFQTWYGYQVDDPNLNLFFCMTDN
jgi:hypothetical protein